MQNAATTTAVPQTQARHQNQPVSYVLYLPHKITIHIVKTKLCVFYLPYKVGVDII